MEKIRILGYWGPQQDNGLFFKAIVEKINEIIDVIAPDREEVKNDEIDEIAEKEKIKAELRTVLRFICSDDLEKDYPRELMLEYMIKYKERIENLLEKL